MKTTSIWECFEVDMLARDLSYADYLHYHRDRKITAQPLTQKEYEALDKVLFDFQAEYRIN